jgi:hypothetical protein
VALSPSSCTPEQIDSYCQLYDQVIQQKGDGNITAKRGPKERLLANELKYRKFCPQAAT